MKKIIVFDFDGVIHSYKSGWVSPRTIPDPPVDGILELLTELVLSDDYIVAIYSSRSNYFGGIRAMKKWLKKWLWEELLKASSRPNENLWQWKIINLYQSMEPFEIHCDYAIKAFIKRIKFPKKKLPAFLTIDDRAICFDGNVCNLMDQIENFKPWYKRRIYED